jgi:hypothetical protein
MRAWLDAHPRVTGALALLLFGGGAALCCARLADGARHGGGAAAPGVVGGGIAGVALLVAVWNAVVGRWPRSPRARWAVGGTAGLALVAALVGSRLAGNTPIGLAVVAMSLSVFVPMALGGLALLVAGDDGERIRRWVRYPPTPPHPRAADGRCAGPAEVWHVRDTARRPAFEPYLVARCECDWVGTARPPGPDAQRAAFAEAGAHTPDVRPGTVPMDM